MTYYKVWIQIEKITEKHENRTEENVSGEEISAFKSFSDASAMVTQISRIAEVIQDNFKSVLTK